MSATSRDIIKLKTYAKTLGISVKILPKKRGAGSAEYISGQCINLFVSKKTAKTDIILSLLHELGHHQDWLDRDTDPEAASAFVLLNNGAMIGKRTDLSKQTRKLIYKDEAQGISYMKKIAKILNLEIPMWKVKLQADVDIHAYKFLYKHGRFATQEETSKYYYDRRKFYVKT